MFEEPHKGLNELTEKHKWLSKVTAAAESALSYVSFQPVTQNADRGVPLCWSVVIPLSRVPRVASVDCILVLVRSVSTDRLRCCVSLCLWFLFLLQGSLLRSAGYSDVGVLVLLINT